MQPLGPSASVRWQVSAGAASLIRPSVPPRAVRADARPKPVTFDLARTAAVVIDMQNEFCHADGWLAGIGVEVAAARLPIAPLAALLPRLREAGVPVVWVNWGMRPDRLNISPSLRHVYDGDGSGVTVLQAGSWSAQLVDELTFEPGDVRVDKHRMSGFWDTPLDSILRNLGVTTLLFAGVNLDQCVLHTMADANFLGYDTLLLEDCAATTNPDFCREATLLNIRQIFGFHLLSTDLLAALPA